MLVGFTAAPPGPVQISLAVPAGSRRCHGQREWLRTGLALINEQDWYANRKAHYADVLRGLAAHMDWRDRTSRPGHDLLRCRACHATGLTPDKTTPCTACGGKPLSADTVGRAVAWLQETGLLGLVSPGTTPDLRPAVLHAAIEGNLAAVYVCAVPRERTQPPPSPNRGYSEFADLSGSRREPDKAPRAREAARNNHEAARATRGLTLLPRPQPSGLHHCPKNRSEGKSVALAIQDRSAWLRGLSPEHVRHLARSYFAAGWTGADVLHALDHDPTGRQHGFSAGVRSAAGWARARLAQWLGPGGTPLPSASQARAAVAARDRAEQARIRAERAERAAKRAEPPGLAHQLRASPLPRSSPTTAPVLADNADPGSGDLPATGATLARRLLDIRDPAGRQALIDAYERARAERSAAKTRERDPSADADPPPVSARCHGGVGGPSRKAGEELFAGQPDPGS